MTRILQLQPHSAFVESFERAVPELLAFPAQERTEMIRSVTSSQRSVCTAILLAVVFVVLAFLLFIGLTTLFPLVNQILSASVKLSAIVVLAFAAPGLLLTLKLTRLVQHKMLRELALRMPIQAKTL